VGLGAADVMMPTVTGETWLQVPETLKIKFTGSLPFGIGGKVRNQAVAVLRNGGSGFALLAFHGVSPFLLA
jgi:homoaconitase/3-isopropylmalate dehydratase large subunit